MLHRSGCSPSPLIGAHEDRKIRGNDQPVLFSDSSSPESFLLHNPQLIHAVNPCTVLSSCSHVCAMWSLPAGAYAHGAGSPKIFKKARKRFRCGILIYGWQWTGSGYGPLGRWSTLKPPERTICHAPRLLWSSRYPVPSFGEGWFVGLFAFPMHTLIDTSRWYSHSYKAA